MNLCCWCSGRINQLDPVRSVNRKCCPFLGPLLFCVFRSHCSKETESGSFWRKLDTGMKLLFFTSRQQLLLPRCAAMHSPKGSNRLPRNWIQVNPSGGQRGELGSQKISLSRSKFHNHQDSWNRTPWDCHTFFTLFGQSNTFQLGTHCSKGQATGLAATAAGIEGKAGFKSSG